MIRYMKVSLNKTDYDALMDIRQVLWIYFLTGNNDNVQESYKLCQIWNNIDSLRISYTPNSVCQLCMYKNAHIVKCYWNM